VALGRSDHRGPIQNVFATTLLTSLTGFLFPISAFTPALATGLLSTVVLAFALLALYVFRLANAWRPIYVVTAVAALRASIPGRAGGCTGIVRHRRVYCGEGVPARAELVRSPPMGEDR
jgi:hypothetical protein